MNEQVNGDRPMVNRSFVRSFVRSFAQPVSGGARYRLLIKPANETIDLEESAV